MERRNIAKRLAEDPPPRRAPAEVNVNFSSQEARKMQAVQEREQDALLEDLGGSLARQVRKKSKQKKEEDLTRQKQFMGQQIGKSVEEQQPLIARVASRTGKSEARVQREIQRIEDFEGKTPRICLSPF